MLIKFYFFNSKFLDSAEKIKVQFPKELYKISSYFLE